MNMFIALEYSQPNHKARTWTDLGFIVGMSGTLSPWKGGPQREGRDKGESLIAYKACITRVQFSFRTSAPSRFWNQLGYNGNHESCFDENNAIKEPFLNNSLELKADKGFDLHCTVLDN